MQNDRELHAEYYPTDREAGAWLLTSPGPLFFSKASARTKG